MKGIIDMHVHSNPDLRHRAYDDFELMEAGIRVGARAIVIKTHQGTTWIGRIYATAIMRSYIKEQMNLLCLAASH